MLSIAEQNQSYTNFAIMLENRAIKKGAISEWRETSVINWRCPKTNKSIGSVCVYLPSDTYPFGKVVRRRSKK